MSYDGSIDEMVDHMKEFNIAGDCFQVEQSLGKIDLTFSIKPSKEEKLCELVKKLT